MNAIAASLITPLWARAAAMFARAVDAIGDARAIALLAFLPRALRREIVGWLYPLECIVRRLLLAEAAELHRVHCASAKRAVRTAVVPLRGMAQTWSLQTRAIPADRERRGSEDPRSMDASRPETWRARFSFALPCNPRSVPNARAPRVRALSGPYTPPPERSPRPALKPEDAPFRLARRFEALRRVLADPRPHAHRLAGAIAREARRTPGLVMRYVLAGPRTDAFDIEDSSLSMDSLGAAFEARAVFKDSS